MVRNQSLHLHTYFLAVRSLSKMDSADDRLDEKEDGGLSLRAKILSLSSGESNWSRNYGWQLLSFTSVILGIGFYFIFVNSPIKAVRLMPNVPKTYGTYARPVQIPPISDDDIPKVTPEISTEEEKPDNGNKNNANPAQSEADAKDNAPQ
jgi:hypothetical protein